jgi:hypothetical protein
MGTVKWVFFRKNRLNFNVGQHTGQPNPARTTPSRLKSRAHCRQALPSFVTSWKCCCADCWYRFLGRIKWTVAGCRRWRGGGGIPNSPSTSSVVLLVFLLFQAKKKVGTPLASKSKQKRKSHPSCHLTELLIYFFSGLEIWKRKIHNSQQRWSLREIKRSTWVWVRVPAGERFLSIQSCKQFRCVHWNGFIFSSSLN